MLAYKTRSILVATNPPTNRRQALPTRRYSKQRDAQRRKERAERERTILAAGIGLGPCMFVTLAKWRIRQTDGQCGRDHNRDYAIRAEVWHLLWTRIKRRWPDAEAWTVVEYGLETGVHLHAVVRNAPGLSKIWFSQSLSNCAPEYDVDDREVWGADGLAAYLTTTLEISNADAGWGCSFHMASKSHGWLPKDLEKGAMTGSEVDWPVPIRHPVRDEAKTQASKTAPKEAQKTRKRRDRSAPRIARKRLPPAA